MRVEARERAPAPPIGGGTRQESSGANLVPFQRALQADDLGADFFEARVEPQRAAEGFQRGDGVVLQHVALSHSRRRGEVIGIDFQGLVAVANRRIVLAQVIVSNSTLTPGFGDRLLRSADQVGGQPGCFAVMPLVVQLDDAAEHLAFITAADAAPQLTDAALGDTADAAIAIDQGLAEHRVRFVIAQQTESEYGGATRGVVADAHKAIQRAARISPGYAFDEQAAILVRQVAIIVNNKNRGANATGGHAMTPLTCPKKSILDELHHRDVRRGEQRAGARSLFVDRSEGCQPPRRGSVRLTKRGAIQLDRLDEPKAKWKSAHSTHQPPRAGLAPPISRVECNRECRKHNEKIEHDNKFLNRP